MKDIINMIHDILTGVPNIELIWCQLYDDIIIINFRTSDWNNTFMAKFYLKNNYIKVYCSKEGLDIYTYQRYNYTPKVIIKFIEQFIMFTEFGFGIFPVPYDDENVTGILSKLGHHNIIDVLQERELIITSYCNSADDFHIVLLSRDWNTSYILSGCNEYPGVEIIKRVEWYRFYYYRKYDIEYVLSDYTEPHITPLCVEREVTLMKQYYGKQHYGVI